MSNVKSIEHNGKQIPYKVTKLAMQKFREKVKADGGDVETIYETDPINSSALMALFAVQAGYRVVGDEPCPYQTVEQIYELDEKTGIIDVIIADFADNEKKSEAS